MFCVGVAREPPLFAAVVKTSRHRTGRLARRPYKTARIGMFTHKNHVIAGVTRNQRNTVGWAVPTLQIAIPTRVRDDVKNRRGGS
jgi:hypothetical protein